ncbi:MAG: ABC transporter permease [Deltaproteobacteria bacterium]|nr:ABC transporter permease [Deltaproteobacteria bacterium]
MAGFSLRRVLAVARKELIHLKRDRRNLPLIFGVPLVQLLILGYAANFDVVDIPVVVVDQDRTAVSRAVAGRLDAGSGFDVIEVTQDRSRAERDLDLGRAEAVVSLPPGTTRRLHRGEAVRVPVWLDGTDTNRAIMAQRYLEAVFSVVAAEVVPPSPAAFRASSEAEAGVLMPPVIAPSLPGMPDPRPRVLYNPTFQSRWFMVPSVVAMVLTVTTLLLSGMAIVKERENGTIEQLAASPIRPWEMLVGKLAPFVLVGLIEGALVTVVGVWWFEIPFAGSPVDLLVMGLVYLVSTLAFGLLASTVSRTQQQAMLSAILIVLPSFLLGGLMYPVDNMAPWAQKIAALLPISYFIAMLRGIFMKGVGFETLGRDVLVLGAIGLVLMILAVLRFRKRSA